MSKSFVHGFKTSSKDNKMGNNRSCVTMPLRSALIMAMLVAAPAARAGYAFQTIDNPGDPTFNQLLGINNSGTIAGYFGSGAAGHPNQGYRVSSPYSSFTSENFPGSAQTQVIGINNRGVTVGFWSNTNTGADANFGFTDVNGTFTNVNNPNTVGSPLAPPINNLLGVNDHNVAVGFYTGAAGDAGYLYDISTKTFSGVTIAGAASVVAAGINNSGAIDGFYTNANGVQLGFLLNGGKLTSLQAPGFSATQLTGISNSGLLVGTGIASGGATDGIVYDSLTRSWSSYSDPLGIGATVFNGVNDKGQIVGFYTNAAGTVNGLLATPVAEPGSLLLFATGLIGLIVVCARKRG